MACASASVIAGGLPCARAGASPLVASARPISKLNSSAVLLCMVSFSVLTLRGSLPTGKDEPDSARPRSQLRDAPSHLPARLMLQLKFYNRASVELASLDIVCGSFDTDPSRASAAHRTVSIRKRPHITKVRSRSRHARTYIVPYRVRGSKIEIARVYHTARRWPNHL